MILRYVPPTTVAIHADDWSSVSPSDQAHYKSAADDCGITLDCSGQTPGGLEVTEYDGIEPGERPTVEKSAFDGEIRCQRPPWEHRLRQLLRLDDPCF